MNMKRLKNYLCWKGGFFQHKKKGICALCHIKMPEPWHRAPLQIHWAKRRGEQLLCSICNGELLPSRPSRKCCGCIADTLKIMSQEKQKEEEEKLRRKEEERLRREEADRQRIEMEKEERRETGMALLELSWGDIPCFPTPLPEISLEDIEDWLHALPPEQKE